MPAVIRELVKALIETLFTIATSPDLSSQEKAARIQRATAALASEAASEAAIDQILKNTCNPPHHSSRGPCPRPRSKPR